MDSVCDYLYIIFTRRYYWWSFLCDIVFLLGFYATVIAIDVDNPIQPPNHKVILLCYLIFLLVYLVWDGYEFLTLPRGKERAFYRAVVFWELPGLFVIGVVEIVALVWNELSRFEYMGQMDFSIKILLLLDLATAIKRVDPRQSFHQRNHS